MIEIDSNNEAAVEPKVTWRTVPVSEMLFALMEQTQGFPTDNVAIHPDSRYRGRHRHLKLYQTGGRYHVQVGRRGSARRYLTECVITYFDGTPTLFQFRFEP